MKKLFPIRKPKIFYGYWIVVATFFCLFVYSGAGFFAFSLFVKPLETDMGWTRGGIMAAFTIFLVIVGVASPFVGRLIYRYEARKVIATGALIVGIGFISVSQVNNLGYFYVSYALIGIGMAAIAHVPSTTIVSNWFKKRRGTAIGLMSTGIGAGGFALAPLVGGLLIPNFGWRVSYIVLGLLTWVLVIPLVLLVVRTKPADMGLFPDGRQAPAATEVTEASSPTAKKITLKMALATSSFWLISVSFLAGCFSQVGILQTQAPYLQDINFPEALAAGTLGIYGLVSVFGKIGFGWLCDRIPAKYAWCIGSGIHVVGVIILMSIEPASPLALIWLFVILTGLAGGSWLPTMAMLVSTNFGLSAYGAIYGMVALFQSIGIATGPLMAGVMYDIMGNYYWAFIVFLASAVVAIPAILAVRRPRPLEARL